MTMNIIAANAIAIAGAALIAIQPGEPAMPDQPGANATASACHIEAAETPDGLLVTAWARSDAGSNYRMVVTQRTGGGGFDIVQEGDVPAGGGEDALLSDILLDTGAAFSARLSTWNAAGERACSWHERA